MKVKIFRCSEPETYWYANHVGTVAEVEDFSGEFVVLGDGVSLIQKNDCVVVLPETPVTLYANGRKADDGQPSQKAIDSHYDLSYTLTQDDIDSGAIKLDPYFVAKVWRTGSRDDTGAIFHILKTCARFNEKNEKAREIRAIYKSIKRLAELENVNLE